MRRALIGLVLLNIAVSSVGARQAPAVDDTPTNSILDLSKTDDIIELLTTSYAADLAFQAAVRTAECTQAEPRCAPLFLAQDVILGPWNFVKLLRVIQETPDSQFSTVFQPRKYKPFVVPAASVLPPEMVPLAEYALEQQVALYGALEAWQVTLERYNAAVSSDDESAAAAQRRALDKYSSQASAAAAALSAVSLDLLETLTPLLAPFASGITLEDAEATKTDLQNNGFGPELKERFSVLGVPQADSDGLLAELTAMSDDVPLDLVDGLTGVAKGYDKLADLMTLADSDPNLRPVADAGMDRAVPVGDGGSATLTLDGRRSTDPEGGPLEYLWNGPSIKASGPNPTITLPPGTYHIALTVSDGKGGTDVDLVTITVGDAAPPRITGVTAKPDVLQSAAGELVRVELDVKVVDNDDPAPSCQIISVSAVETANTAGGGATKPEVVLEGDLTVLLRAGRAYTVTVQCADKSSHSSSRSTVVSVPPDAGFK